MSARTYIALLVVFVACAAMIARASRWLDALLAIAVLGFALALWSDG